MFGSQVLEVAVGLTVVFVVLSAACSGIKEFIAGIAGMRSKTLEEGVRHLLQDPAVADKVFAHPLIASTAAPGSKPSYISSHNFALALFDVLGTVDKAAPNAAADLRANIAKVPNDKLRQTLLTLVTSTQGNIDQAQAKVEHWFDDAMDRVSGWYKRRAQTIILMVGVFLCCALNGDTLMIVRELWNDQVLREVVTAQARYKVQNPPPSGNDLSAMQQEVRDASVPPIGWHSNDPERGLPEGWVMWLKKVLGILISVLAISMGAPFWFDMLNKLVNLRFSGSPPPDSRPASSR